MVDSVQDKVDVAERSGRHTASPQVLETRLFVQLLAFSCGHDLPPKVAIRTLAEGIKRAGIKGVVYRDANHPRGLALLTLSEEPAEFVEKVQPVLDSSPLAGLVSRPELSMLGRTYATGFEADLKFSLLERPVQTALNEAWPWAVWYPLRRSGAFARLESHEQGAILREHATIGQAYGQADLAHDIRLACHGLDANDNDFVVGLVGRELHPLSHLIQVMRTTRQTSEYISKMGPFFVGRIAARVA